MSDYDWAGLVDATLRTLKGKTNLEAADLLGVSEGTIQRWRKAQSAGAPIPEPRGAPREALLRTVDVKNGRKELLRGKGGGRVSVPNGAGEGGAGNGYRELMAQIERAFAETARPPEEREAWARANEIAEPILRIAEREAIAATVRAEALRAAAHAMERGEMASAVRAQLAGGGHAGALSMEETMRRVVAQALKEQAGAAGGTGTLGPNHP